MKKIISLTLCLCLLLPLVACGGESSSSEVIETSSPEVETPKTEISYLSFSNFASSGELDFERELINKFEQANSDIKVNYTKVDYANATSTIENMISSGGVPNIIFDTTEKLLAYEKEGLLLSCANLNLTADEYYEQVLTASTYKDNLYCLPAVVSPYLMGFNKNLLDRYGLLDYLPLNNDGRNWNYDEYLALLKKLKAALNSNIYSGIVYVNSAAGDKGTRAFIYNMYNSKFMSDDNSELYINARSGIDACDNLAYLVKYDYLYYDQDKTALDALDDFINGEAVHTLYYSPTLKLANNDLKADGFEDVFIPYPNSEGTPKYEFSASGFAGMKSDDEAKNEATMKFLKFIAENDDILKDVAPYSGAFSSKKS
ncbi:MAG: carbohydrate ABC transporter substrate-binding protein, partial [Oscillospiraceae bacterium]|nr:carbohydrate ABC transporter substrate-binding protein [Oscillospiraceae bacterium]